MSNAEKDNNISLETIISSAVQVPGVKVSRESFLAETFKKQPASVMSQILAVGPIEAGCCTRDQLKSIAKSLVNKRTLQSGGVSFMAGLPGGLVMAATIPADTLQFFAVALRLAQEVSYLYGAEDLWTNGALDHERVQSQLILYCGVMFGASGATATVKVLSSSLAKQALKKLPQKALTKTFYYPIVKAVAKAVGARMTKDIFAKGVSKAVPIIGGFVSGGITLASMLPMGMRLVNTLDESNFAYTEKEARRDLQQIVQEYQITDIPWKSVPPSEEPVRAVDLVPERIGHDEFVQKLRTYKELLDDGVLDEKEFQKLKANLMAEMNL